MTTAIYTDSTINFDHLGYDLLNERVLRDLGLALVVILSLVYWAYTVIAPRVAELVTVIRTEIDEFNVELLREAWIETIEVAREDIGYFFTTIRTYWLQLVTPPHSDDWDDFNDLF